MGKATFGQALEALQIEQLMNGNQEMIPYVLAVVFLREGETVDDVNISLRAETMRRLPVTTAMNVIFFSSFREHLVKTHKPLFRSDHDAKARRAGVDQLSRFGWYNLLWAAAEGKLTHFEQVKKMNVLAVFQFLLRQREEAEFNRRLQKLYHEDRK